MFFPPCNQFNGVELEIAHGNYGYRMYVNVFARPLACDPEVVVTINDLPVTYKVERFDGGQRVLLPDNAAERVMQAMKDGQAVDIAIGRYRSIITPQGFGESLNNI